MKNRYWVLSFQVFGLLVHLFLAAALIGIGFFDLFGLAPHAQSSAQLLSKLAASQSSAGTVDPLTHRIADETISAATMLLSAMKTLAISAAISFVAHVIGFRRKHQEK